MRLFSWLFLNSFSPLPFWLSFLLFPVGLVAGVVGIVLGSIALARTQSKRATNQGQAIAGLTCSVVAVLVAILLAVRVGGWIARNTGPLGRLDRCITQSHNRASVADCFGRFANEVRP